MDASNDAEITRIIELADKHGFTVASPWIRKVKTCIHCGKWFAIKGDWRAQRRRYCSMQCNQADYFQKNYTHKRQMTQAR
jgi:predicted RNA-binding Zn ribbon-like protein